MSSGTDQTALAAALIGVLDDDALDLLAERLRPRLAQPDEARLLTPVEAAERLGCHPKTLVRAASAGRVRGAERVGRAWRFRAGDLTLDPPANFKTAAPPPGRPASSAATGRAAARAIRARRCT
jgi:excisionase family DNA binding protein